MTVNFNTNVKEITPIYDELFGKNLEWVREKVDEMNMRILFAGERTTLREVYMTLKFPVPNGFDELFDLFGWDEKGFRQLYEMKRVPID